MRRGYQGIPEIPFMLMGDFNMRPPTLKARLGGCLGLSYRVPFGDPRNFLDLKDPSGVPKKISALDHCVITAPALLEVGQVRMIDTLDVGVDHLPVITTLKLRRGTPAPIPNVVRFVCIGLEDWQKDRFWNIRWLKSWAKKGAVTTLPRVQPVKDATGELIYEDDAVVQRWKTYIEGLLAPTEEPLPEIVEEHTDSLTWWSQIPGIN
ncbi:hypothetical protein R1sor_013031 [Riccia sorocarpa]|uniref:Endonuclease/exonuclease/phosphatase domain-containing protein n=1 Tax=Riccia sorocarpa TaxID=122646 RepID=A0ABD3H825_9MARC